MLEMAGQCGPVNRDALLNDKVNIMVGDGREVLLSSRRTYDLIVSAPSNPYRAGIASMYTREFYSAVAKRLREKGMFSQWVQAYDVDATTIQTIYATLSSVFPHVMTWQTNTVDLLLVCSADPVAIDVDLLRRRVLEEPYRSALEKAWRVIDVEGFLGRFVADSRVRPECGERFSWPDQYR